MIATKHKTIKKSCQICGKSYRAKSNKGKFCSNACKQRDKYERDKKEIENQRFIAKKKNTVIKTVTRNGRVYVSGKRFKCAVCNSERVHYSITEYESRWWCDDCNAEVIGGIEIKSVKA
jgi:endogenous inhibitor of DNA gyrase (YacG/DUF329 family)